MSQIILDTHIWLWYINQNFDKLPQPWIQEIEQADQVGISPISCYEIVMAHNKGRISFEIPIEEWLDSSTKPAGIELIPITPTIALRAVNLSPIHKDPFDRLIIATTLEYQARLASVDSIFPKYPELKNYLMKS